MPASRWTAVAAATEAVAGCPAEASTGKKGGGVQRPAEVETQGRTATGSMTGPATTEAAGRRHPYIP